MESKAIMLEKLSKLAEEAQADLVQKGLLKDRYHMVKNSHSLTTSSFTRQERKVLNSVEFFFLFSPKCIHCVRMARTLKGIKTVKPLQVKGSKLHHFPGLPKSTLASPQTVKGYAPDGKVPVLIVYDRKQNKLLRITGNQNKRAILKAVYKLKKRRIK